MDRLSEDYLALEIFGLLHHSKLRSTKGQSEVMIRSRRQGAVRIGSWM
jgi:hypothetical protein